MRLLIAGAGGHGRVVADAASAAGWKKIAFLDDRYPDLSTTGVWKVVGKLQALSDMPSHFDSCLAAFGDARLRLHVLDRARTMGFQTPMIVHPRATISVHASVAEGSVVMAAAVVNAFSAIGVGCIINTGATVDHDCELAPGVHVCPGAHVGGGVKIGARTWFGIGAVAVQGISIGADVTVGAGAVCVKNVRDGVTVIGVPAKER